MKKRQKRVNSTDRYVEVKRMNKNYEYFIEANLQEHAGKWIAIANARVIASGSTAVIAERKAQKKTEEEPLIVNVPE